MKKVIMLILLSVILLNGCSSKYDTSDACNKYISENSKYQECIQQFANEVKQNQPSSSNPIEECESETGELKQICYFKKALDSKDHKICLSNAAKIDQQSCITNIAGILKDETICDSSPYEHIVVRCKDNVKKCINNTPNFAPCTIVSYACNTGLLSQTQKEYCIEKYGLVFET